MRGYKCRRMPQARAGYKCRESKKRVDSRHVKF
nr:MAG TPA: hypothetical protein [Caudoviricetes sp.]